MAGISETTQLSGHIRKIDFGCIAAADGLFADTAIATKFEGRIIKLVVNPGTPAPTDDFDVEIFDQHGTDLLEGLGSNQDVLTTADIPLIYSGTALHPVVDEVDVLTLRISGNLVADAELAVQLYVALGV